MQKARIVPIRKKRVSAIYFPLSCFILLINVLQQIFFLPILSLAEQVQRQIQHLGIQTASEIQSFLVIQSMMQLSCMQPILPVHSQRVIRGLESQQQILHRVSSNSGLQQIICSVKGRAISEELSINYIRKEENQRDLTEWT